MTTDSTNTFYIQSKSGSRVVIDGNVAYFRTQREAREYANSIIPEMPSKDLPLTVKRNYVATYMGK